MSAKIDKTDRQWRDELTPAQYEVLRRKGTEPPFTGGYVHTKNDGMYRCAGCGTALFSSDAKFDSGTGWPSFTEPATSANIELHTDRSLFMERTEVTCAACGGHLGHVFDDGPRDRGGKRYCINSVALELATDDEA
jgi:peptide-methionine (R)-S-oxide reductase